MKYDSETLKQINDSVNLFEYASQFHEFQKKGNDFFTSCPLHLDLTPSLCFTPEKNSYYCFSCGRGGQIIKYLMDFENLSFDEAVEKAANLAEIDLSKICKSDTIAFLKRVRDTKPKLKTEFEHKILPPSTMEQFKKAEIVEWQSEGIKQDVMDLFGVRYDTYGNRIVYPVYDINGDLINVKGRTRYKNYKELKLAKYINYHTVGCMDYFQCLDKTLPYIREKNEVIIFESIKSVMLAYGWGYKNCVSAEKHTLTNEQIDLLIKLRVNIVFAYDSDVNYYSEDVQRNIEKLKRITNVYLIRDKDKLLGGAEAKNSPVDCGQEIWKELYESKRKVV